MVFFVRELGEAFCNNINKVASGELTEWRTESLASLSELELRTAAKAQRASTSGGLLWRFVGGMPTDWITRTDTTLLSSTQIDLVEKKLERRLGITEKVRGLNPKVWWPISRQIFADVAKNGKPERIDTFNGMYGLNRGLAATFALACVAAVQEKWSIALGLLVLTGVYDYRAYGFGVYYGRELFLQFLVLD
jgi:hypothetical protein